MKVIPKEERCSEPNIPDWSGWHSYQCSRRGTITEESKLWCFQHAPSKIKVRQAKSDARFKADQDRRLAPSRELDRLRAVNAKLLEALEASEAYATRIVGSFPPWDDCPMGSCQWCSACANRVINMRRAAIKAAKS
jgi:hypothetical protein